MRISGVIFLVRHGETEWNRDRRYQGWLDSPLTPEGIAQAEAIGRRLRLLPEAADADIVTSPLGRARHTATIIAECLSDARGHRQPIRFDERLREISLGSWDGLGKREIRRRAPELFTGEDGRWEWYFRSPDGETYDVFRRPHRCLSRRSRAAPVIAVCHGVVTRVLRGLYAGLPREKALRLRCRRIASSGSPATRSRRSRPDGVSRPQASSVRPLPRPTMGRTAAAGEREWRPICLN